MASKFELREETIEISRHYMDVIKEMYPEGFLDYMLVMGWTPTMEIVRWKNEKTGRIVSAEDAVMEFESTYAVQQ